MGGKRRSLFKSKRQKRIAKTLTKHHSYPKSRFGEANSKQPIIALTWDKHQKWHALWGNKSIEEVFLLLLRLMEMKGCHRLTSHFRTEFYRTRFSRVD